MGHSPGRGTTVSRQAPARCPRDAKELLRERGGERRRRIAVLRRVGPGPSSRCSWPSRSSGCSWSSPTTRSSAGSCRIVVAFSMFSVVGALIVSREQRNVIGGLFLYGRFVIAFSFMSGELLTWLVSHGTSGAFAQIMGLLSNTGWLLGILPIVILSCSSFPDGHLPSRRWRPFLWFFLATLVLLFVSLTFASRRSPDRARMSASPTRSTSVSSTGSASPDPGVLRRLLRHVRDVADFAVPAVPAFDGDRAAADQVGRVRVPRGLHPDPRSVTSSPTPR